MSDRNLRLQVVLGAVDKLTRPFKQAQQGTKSLASEIQKTRNQLKKLDAAGSDLQRFTKLSQSLKETSSALEKAKISAQSMSQEYSALTTPTKKQTDALEKQWRAVSKLQDAEQKETRQMALVRAELYRLGVSANGGSRETARIRQETQRYNQQLSEQERRLQQVGERQRKLNAIKARSEKSLELRNNLAGTGAGAMAAGVTTGLSLLAPVRAYTDSENASTQLAASMMGPGAKVLPEFKQINELATRLGDKLPGTTADFQNMMTMLRRQGMSAQTILGGLGEATAYLGVQLRMAPTDAAEFAAKLQDATQTSEKDMMALTDIIQKGFYAGVDPDNMLQGYAKIGSAMDIIRKKGIDAAKVFAPLLVMADQSSMAGESAGNAYRKVFQSMLDVKSVKAANAQTKGTGIHFDFTDGHGEFGGIDKMYQQLAQLSKLNTQTKKSIIKTLFGDDAETLQVVGILTDKGMDGYKDAANKLSQQASLRERVDASLSTLANKWEAAGGSFTNALSSIGATVAPQLKVIADWLGDLASRLDVFVKAHPQFVRALFVMGAVFTVAAIGAGALSLALASVLGPMALVRMSASVLSLKFTSGFGLIRNVLNLVGNGILWLGRLMLANPILAVIGLIAAGALLIWQHWGTIGPKFHALWDSIANAVSSRWEAIKQGFSQLWSAIITEIAALPQQFASFGGALIDSLLAGINSKWEALKTKLSSLSDYLPDWLTGKGSAPTLPKAPNIASTDKTGKAVLPAGGFPPMGYAGMYDTGGRIGRGQFGIVGENGPEIVNGPANITSRRKTAALASVVAGFMGVTLPQADAQAKPLITATPNQASTVARTPSQPSVITHRYDINAPITIYAQPGQSASDIASEVARQLDARERKAQAKARSNFSDQGGLDL
ncbi:phage tail tape measure protein, TP901 family, core region [Rosenbergiella nectarea]|uniref:Phage tail tape measure protein, TP901 family, core region n=1 Tax=Rosenbergiella nectarea TaxID=988801 RepID=A0A1H9EYQ5_9GAMM|nr:phage tail tape measure protein [Rosenbergiella nectarea]SEQ30765.1 phage tail tape measure protein, TP901 family, core region [Rosenbergiella nectarea]